METVQQDRIAAMVRRAAPAPEMTLTEQKLCRMWLQASHAGGWWELYQQLMHIRDVLQTVSPGNNGGDVSAMFHDAGTMALARMADDLQNREAA